MKNEEIIQKFYTAFAQSNFKEMAACYHKDIVFQDPAFGELKGEKAGKMWEMLISQSSAPIDISFSNIKADGDKGSANWRAEYVYGPQKRKVINNIAANFIFKDGKIIQHTDVFDMWKWASQAMGLMGSLLGWTPFLKNKVQSVANKRLDAFMNTIA